MNKQGLNKTVRSIMIPSYSGVSFGQRYAANNVRQIKPSRETEWVGRPRNTEGQWGINFIYLLYWELVRELPQANSENEQYIKVNYCLASEPSGQIFRKYNRKSQRQSIATLLGFFFFFFLHFNLRKASSNYRDRRKNIYTFISVY